VRQTRRLCRDAARPFPQPVAMAAAGRGRGPAKTIQGVHVGPPDRRGRFWRASQTWGRRSLVGGGGEQRWAWRGNSGDNRGRSRQRPESQRRCQGRGSSHFRGRPIRFQMDHAQERFASQRGMMALGPLNRSPHRNCFPFLRGPKGWRLPSVPPMHAASITGGTGDTKGAGKAAGFRVGRPNCCARHRRDQRPIDVPGLRAYCWTTGSLHSSVSLTAATVGGARIGFRMIVPLRAVQVAM
jgi:hypothetical protein